MQFKIKIADVTIGINSLYDEVYNMCSDYLSDESEAFGISISQADIDFEREKSNREAAYEGLPIGDYSDAYLETLAVYRKIAVKLLDYNVLLMHGSVVCADGFAYLFSAPSGTGKTTHSRLWIENIDGAFILNGDKPLIRITDDGCTVYGTPWSGKEGINRNASAPLKAICFLQRSAENGIAELKFSEVYPAVFQQVYRPTEPENMLKTINLIKKLGAATRFYLLSCNMEPDAAITAYNGMK